MDTIYKCGNEALLGRDKTAFLCSRRVPDGVVQAVEEWLLTLSADTDCVMCGDQSAVERMVFSRLLERGVPAVLVLAESMPSSWSVACESAMREGRLLAITHCDASVHIVSARSARDRNMLMIAMAAEVVVGYCTKGGNLYVQLSGARRVRYLFQDEAVGGTFPVDGGGSAPAAVSAVVCKAAAPWQRRMWAVNGAVTVEFDGSGAEPCFRVWQAHDFSIDGGSVSKIVLSPRELRDFHEALGEVIIQVGDKALADVEAVTVSSANGNITFGFKMLTDDGVLVIMQTAETKFMGQRKCSVLINALEIRTFYEKVSEAADKAVGLG